MGTSNWQQIPFCIDALMKMAPSRVLDVGVGFGRWGMITREFCDVWYSRIFKDEWAVHLEGIEAFPRSITDYHRQFYNAIHLGDASEILPTLPGPWTVVIFGDVLEHFTKEKANELLSLCLDRSEYVLVNIPIGEEHPQGEAYGNVYERHLSSWEVSDFRPFGLVRHAMFRDYIGRPYGSFVLSRDDPKRLAESLFSKEAEYPDESTLGGMKDGLARVTSRLADQAFELGYIKSSGTFRLARALRENPLSGLARSIAGGSGDTITVRALGVPGPSGRGDECWVLGLKSAPSERGIPWEFIRRSGRWEEKPSDYACHGRALVSTKGSLSARVGADPELVVMTHPFSGAIEISFRGRTKTLDLYSPSDGTMIIRPGRDEWVAPRVTPKAAPAQVEVKPRRLELTEYDREFGRRCRNDKASVVAVHCPRWLGVTTSTRILFPHCYAAPNTPDADPFQIDDADIDRYARALVETGAKQFVFSGGDEAHLRIADRIRTLSPGATVDLLWHGSYAQIGEDYVWHILKLWIAGVKDGRIRSICTVKAGMEEFFRAQGIPSSLLLNYVPGESLGAPELPESPLEVGLWISGHSHRKNPLVQLCAISMLGECRVHASGLDDRSMDLAKSLRLEFAHAADAPIPRDAMLASMRSTHISLYVTNSECCPMLPLESLQQGVPCLISSTSHLFEDHPYLHDRLVVPSPDRADVIAAYARRASDERARIIEAWREYAPAYEERARRSVEAFLNEGPSLTRGPLPALQGEAVAGA